MEIRELRIGNLVNVPRLGQSAFRIDIIEHLSKNHDKVGVSQPIAEGFPTHPLTLFLEDLQPIPLTEEILLKCGFEDGCKSIYAIYLPNDGSYFHVKYSVHNNGFYVVLEGFYASRRIKSVHQLQNIIFALTGEELKINL